VSYQIIFFKKSKCDFERTEVVASASEGDLYASNALNRNNTSAWLTTGSTDASLTTFEVDFQEVRDITDILLIKHNFKNFTVKYWNGSSFVAFSTPISETVNTAETTHYTRAVVSTQKLQITVNGTMVANSDKYMYQFIATEQIGQLNAWPVIKKPELSRNRIKNQMLSGKFNVVENVGDFSCSLYVKALSSDADLTIIETLYSSTEGFLVWLCGGSETQFKTVRQGYRLEDLYLMKCLNEYLPEYYKGLYNSAIGIELKLQEVIT
jgi:hypothetical protein